MLLQCERFTEVNAKDNVSHQPLCKCIKKNLAVATHSLTFRKNKKVYMRVFVGSILVFFFFMRYACSY
jgi:hypothetical protein